MTTKAKPKNPDSRPKGKAVVPAPVSGPVPPGMNDTRADDQPVIGQFVEVTKGEHKGFFGVFLEAEGNDAVVRNRSDAGVRIVVPLADLAPSSPNRR
jgi:hypothetical protein